MFLLATRGGIFFVQEAHYPLGEEIAEIIHIRFEDNRCLFGHRD